MRLYFITACLLGASAVAAGAFGAHALREAFTEQTLAVWNTAARYQLTHAIALLVAVVASRWTGEAPRPVWACRFFTGGIVLFSGSLYGLCAGGGRWLGPLTPIGGASLLAGWGFLAWWGIRHLEKGQS